MGFSWGGVVTMLAATQPYAEALAAPGQKFAAHAAFYPVLWSYNVVPGHEFASLTGAPVLVQAGGEDAYDTPASVRAFLDRLAPDVRDLVELVVHGGATHAFDRAGPAKIIHDPFAHNGAGGPVRFEHHPAAALAAREAVFNFFAGVFSPVASGSEPQTGPGVRR